MFAELADGQGAQRPKTFVVECVEQEAANVVSIRVDERTIDDVAEGHIGEDELGGDALALGPRRQPGEPVAGFLLVGPREQLAQIGEGKMLAANRRLVRHDPSSPKTWRDRCWHSGTSRGRWASAKAPRDGLAMFGQSGKDTFGHRASRTGR
jgi:hypothetical protein